MIKNFIIFLGLFLESVALGQEKSGWWQTYFDPAVRAMHAGQKVEAEKLFKQASTEARKKDK